jgi:hypothetical protein
MRRLHRALQRASVTDAPVPARRRVLPTALLLVPALLALGAGLRARPARAAIVWRADFERPAGAPRAPGLEIAARPDGGGRAGRFTGAASS